ncbi:hypothetical protein EON80_06585 [bacterium]|nr:MAG: hypothetical protein EON80_06585 [bacterium]
MPMVYFTPDGLTMVLLGMGVIEKEGQSVSFNSKGFEFRDPQNGKIRGTHRLNWEKPSSDEWPLCYAIDSHSSNKSPHYVIALEDKYSLPPTQSGEKMIGDGFAHCLRLFDTLGNREVGYFELDHESLDQKNAGFGMNLTTDQHGRNWMAYHTGTQLLRRSDLGQEFSSRMPVPR